MGPPSLFKELQITLYDIFGYFLPGAVIVAAFLVLFWTLFWPTFPLRIPVTLPFFPGACIALVAYLAGHMGQAVGNFLEKLPTVKKTLEAKLPVSHEFAELVRDAVSARFGEKARSLNPKELWDLCDQALLFGGSPGEREIFVYREGFYRGCCVAFSFLALTLLPRIIWQPAVVCWGSHTVAAYRGEITLAIAIAGLGAWLSFRRYLRFACIKKVTCLARFLALVASPPGHKETK